MQKTQQQNHISRKEILDLGDYEREREAIRSNAIAARRVRRIELGPNASLSFENRETVLYQIQEMLRAERIAKEREVQHEIETYSDLLPSASELSATLMFEFPDEADRSVRLRDLVGFENHLRIDVDGAGSAKPEFDRRQIDADRISAVQFLRFPLEDSQRRALAAGARLRVVADHPHYSYVVDVPEDTRRALANDIGASGG